jgi:hypothetical protein
MVRRFMWTAVVAAICVAAGASVAEESWREVAGLTAGGGSKDVKVTGTVSKIMLRCDSGAVSINTLVVLERAHKTPLPVTSAFKAGEMKVIDLQQEVRIVGLRISDEGDGAYSVHVK